MKLRRERAIERERGVTSLVRLEYTHVVGVVTQVYFSDKFTDAILYRRYGDDMLYFT